MASLCRADWRENNTQSLSGDQAAEPTVPWVLLRRRSAPVDRSFTYQYAMPRSKPLSRMLRPFGDTAKFGGSSKATPSAGVIRNVYARSLSSTPVSALLVVHTAPPANVKAAPATKVAPGAATVYAPGPPRARQ